MNICNLQRKLRTEYVEWSVWVLDREWSWQAEAHWDRLDAEKKVRKRQHTSRVIVRPFSTESWKHDWEIIIVITVRILSWMQQHGDGLLYHLVRLYDGEKNRRKLICIKEPNKYNITWGNWAKRKSWMREQ